jgi:hypothetical protein
MDGNSLLKLRYLPVPADPSWPSLLSASSALAKSDGLAKSRTSCAEPILRFVHRIFWPCQSRMSIDPIDSILLGSKFPKIVRGPIRPHYLHAPNAALFHHWR